MFRKLIKMQNFMLLIIGTGYGEEERNRYQRIEAGSPNGKIFQFQDDVFRKIFDTQLRSL